MTISQTQSPRGLFHSEHECVEYLFAKRWPGGFICPFCHCHQPETGPAFTVVCHYCRKQTSITARTVMHGSRNSLISWMLVAWQFCSRKEGISAREIQNLLALSSYQTSWKWLQKIRCAAALAESKPCLGTVMLGIRQFSGVHGEDELYAPDIGLALELDSRAEPARVRFTIADSRLLDIYSILAADMVGNGSLLLLDDCNHVTSFQDRFTCRQQSQKEHQLLTTLLEEGKGWLNQLYRKGVGSNYLQLYLDEFAFRYNTRNLPDSLLVFEHFLTGLLATVPSFMPHEQRQAIYPKTTFSQERDDEIPG